MVSLPTLLLILAALSIGATVIAILVSLRSAREARSAIFPIVREEETIRARRARITVFILSAVTALFLGGWLATLRLSPPPPPVAGGMPPPSAVPAITFVTKTPSPISESAALVVSPTLPTEIVVIPTQTPQPTPTAIIVGASPTEQPSAPVPTPTAIVVGASPTPQPTSTPTSTPLPPTATATNTATPLPTITPTPTPVPMAQLVTSAPRTPAPPGIRVGPIKFATDITPNIEPVNPNTLFPQDTKSIYAVYPYSGMVNGVNFAAVWYQNGAELWRDEQVWHWGKTAQFYSFLNPPGEGLYKLDLYVNDTVVATGLFEIR